jgi:DNA invertase Pin-like site-specific DNA recombinase
MSTQYPPIFRSALRADNWTETLGPQARRHSVLARMASKQRVAGSNPARRTNPPPRQRRTAIQAFDRYRRSREVALAESRATAERLHDDGAPYAAIARAVGISRQRLWKLLRED